MTCINPVVIDLSHYNIIEKDLEDARAFGILGVIHKATQGTNYIDKKYVARRWLAQQSGMLWGAYHFLRPGDMAGQVAHFVRIAQPDEQTLMAVDHEDSNGTSASLQELRLFMELLADAIGRKPVLYSGHLIKQQLQFTVSPFFGAHRLWLAQYGSRPLPQRSWSRAWLWQFTGDGIGPEPHHVPGVTIEGSTKGIDVNHYDGTPEQLAASWA